MYYVKSFARGCRFRLTRRLVSRQPCDIWPSIDETAVECRPLLSRFGNVSLYERNVLCAAAKHTAARRIFEFGTFDGLTTWHLATNCGPQARVFTLDLPLDHPARQNNGHDRTVGKIFGVAPGTRFQQSPIREQVTQLLVDSLAFDGSVYRETMDSCFIDASHEYEHVAKDTQNALVMTRPGGVVFWHDYSRWWPGVQKCLDELARRMPVFRIANTSLACLVVPDVSVPNGSASSSNGKH